MTTKGFTIVELLIVIVVIAVLAAISVVAFNQVQQRARVTNVTSSLAQAKKKIELHKAETGSYPTTAQFTSIGVPSGETTFQYSSDGLTYCLSGSNGSTHYKHTETSTPSSGVCTGHTQGGVATVTNLVTNPSFKNDYSSWTGNAASLARVTTPWILSDGALQITPTNQDSFAGITVPAVAGRTYTAIGTLHVPAVQTGTFQGSGQQRNLFYEFRNSSGGFTGTGGGQTTPSANAVGTYTHRGTGVAPANTTSLRLRLYNGANVGGGTVLWDHIMIVEGSYSGNYGDGSSPSWGWNGTEDASTSTGPAL